MWLALQLSHNDVLGVGLGWVLGLGGPESLPQGYAYIQLPFAQLFYLAAALNTRQRGY